VDKSASRVQNVPSIWRRCSADRKLAAELAGVNVLPSRGGAPLVGLWVITLLFVSGKGSCLGVPRFVAPTDFLLKMTFNWERFFSGY